MNQIILKTDMPNQAAKFLFEALETEKLRLNYSMKLAERRLSRFEKKYRVTSKEFIEEWSAEDLEGKDLEYVECTKEHRACPFVIIWILFTVPYRRSRILGSLNPSILRW